MNRADLQIKSPTQLSTKMLRFPSILRLTINGLLSFESLFLLCLFLHFLTESEVNCVKNKTTENKER